MFCHILVPIHANDFADFGPDAAQSRFEFGALVVWPLDHLQIYFSKLNITASEIIFIFFLILAQKFCFHSPHTTIVHLGSRLLMHSSLLLSGLLKILGYFYVASDSHQGGSKSITSTNIEEHLNHQCTYNNLPGFHRQECLSLQIFTFNSLVVTKIIYCAYIIKNSFYMLSPYSQ